MNFSPKVKDWVKPQYLELKARNHVALADIETLLQSPEIKKLWTLLGTRTLGADYRRSSSNKVLHLADAISVARRGIPADDRIPTTTKKRAARKIRDAVARLNLAWTEMHGLVGGEVPGHFVESINSAALTVAAEFERDIAFRNPHLQLTVPEAVPGSLYAVAATAHAYTRLESLLGALTKAADTWPDQPQLVPKPRSEDAERLYFFRKLASLLRAQYAASSMSREAREVMAALYNSGPQLASNIDEFPPASRVPRRPSAGEKAIL